MIPQYSYKTLLITEESNLKMIEEYRNLATTLEMNLNITYSVMTSLEYLMDNSVDTIIIDLNFGKDEVIEFLGHLADDYENKLTPIILISEMQDCENFIDAIADFNVLSIIPKTKWNIHINKLLYFLKIQKFNLRFLQSSLIESEDRGTIDPLTSAYNRYGCEDIFHSLTSRVKAYDEPFSIVMLDIDHFKKINDTYGHDVGDNVLQDFSKIIIDSIRKNDSLVRLGGEEFLIFLSNANLDIAKKIAENLREKIQATPHSPKKISITSSFGVVQYQDKEEFDAILKRVDELIYKAKESGRNIVIS